MKYSVIEFGSGGVDAQAFVGLCLPRQCSDGVITKSINSAFKIMGLPLNVFSIDSNTENYDFPMNWLSYLTAFILVAIGVLVFAATVRGCDRKEKEGSEIKSEIKLERGEKRVKESDNKWVACFDLSTNIRQHFKIRENEDLNVWDGIRSISMMWVIIGHCYTFSLGGVINIANY
jgi:TctA family transporter